MKVSLKQTIAGLDGKVINGTREAFVISKDITGKEVFLQDQAGNDLIITRTTPEKTLTLKEQLINALLTQTPSMSAGEKAERFALFFKIESCKEEEIEFTAEEISLCKKCNNETASILVAGRCNMMLEGK